MKALLVTEDNYDAVSVEYGFADTPDDEKIFFLDKYLMMRSDIADLGYDYWMCDKDVFEDNFEFVTKPSATEPTGVIVK